MDANLIEVGMVALGSGTATGAITLAGLRVHIQYLREQDKRQSAELETAKLRITAAERDILIVQNTTERAHHRIDELRAAL